MIQNKNVLKSFFETGDKPSQQNYFDLIDSLLPMIGEVRATSFAFAPQGWRKCNGELLAPSDFPELFALIGTTYGGDGVDTFALPNLCGRIPLGYGATEGLSTYSIGQTGGEETTQLTEDQLPAHNHNVVINNSGSVGIPVNGISGEEDTQDPSQGVLANIGQDFFSSSESGIYNGNTIPVSGLDIETVPTGNGTSINNLPPYLALNYIIAVEGFNPL